MPPASRAPNPRGERRKVPRRPSGTMWYGLGFLFLLILAQTYFLVPAGRQLPYSEFKSLVAQGKIADATVGEQIIRGTLKTNDANGKPEAFVTTRIEDPALVAELEKSGVKYSGELMNRWLPELLSWIVPLLLLVALTDAAKEWLVREGYDPAYGARPLKRAIQKHILDPLAMRVLEAEFREGDVVQVDAGKEGLQFSKQPAGAVLG